MKILRNPRANAVIILSVTAFYAFLFSLLSGHIEFLRILSHPRTLNSVFWNTWTKFLTEGNLKYIGYAYIILSAAIAYFTLSRGKNYDEYQASVFEKGLLLSGAALLILFPLSLICVLSDVNYAVETLLFLAAFHWLVLLTADLVYVMKRGKG